ncbi:MAG: hypothetical protein M3473_02235 [Chloroflexota bacterium]|nr:hypothetical protein [Chloroflexota bacterium]
MPGPLPAQRAEPHPQGQRADGGGRHLAAPDAAGAGPSTNPLERVNKEISAAGEDADHVMAGLALPGDDGVPQLEVDRQEGALLAS